MTYHLIIGYGNWSKKILNYLIKRKKDKIIVKTRKHLFFYPSKIKITNKESFIKSNVKSIHICSPLNTHFFYLNKFSWCNQVLVEKPFLQNINQFIKTKKFYNKNRITVNYTDLYNPVFRKIVKDTKSSEIKKVTLNYSKRSKFYKNLYDSTLDWLDHPLSLILSIFYKFPKFEIKKIKILNNDGFQEQLKIKYFFSNFSLFININHTKNNQRNLKIFFNKFYKKYNFSNNTVEKNTKKIYINRKNNLDNIYSIFNGKDKLLKQALEFHKKIFLEKIKIIKKIKKNIIS